MSLERGIRSDPPPAPGDGEPTLRDYLGILRRRGALIAAALLVTSAAALGFSYGQPPVYRATATVVADRPGSVIALFPGGAGAGQDYIDTLAEIVKSRAVAERAARVLGFGGTDVATEALVVQASVSVQRIRYTDMIRIDAHGRTPEEAARRADAVAQGFINLSLEARRAQASAARTFIEDQIAVVTRDLRASEEALVQFKAQGGNVSLSEQTSLKVNRLAEFEAELATARTERRSVEAQLNRARAELERRAKIAPATWTASPLISPLRQQLASLEVELAGLQEQFTEKHPAVLAIRAKIAQTKTKLSEQMARSLDAQTYAVDPAYQYLSQQVVQAEVARSALVAKEGALGATIERWAGLLRDLPPRELSLARLTRDHKVAEQVYLLLSGKYQEARITEASVVSDIRIIDRAALPLAPVEPNPVKNGLTGGVLGLLLGIVAAFTMEGLDRTFKTAKEAERVLGLPALGVIPRTGERPWAMRNGKRVRLPIPLVRAMNTQAPFVEAHRTLRTNLLYCAPGEALRTVLVTSPGPGEGKTTTAVNLAASLTQLAGMRVALCECDLRRPTLAGVFEISEAVGLSDYLVGERSVAGEVTESQVVFRTAVEGLEIIPAGRPTPNPSELLASARLREYLGRLRERHDLVVIDSPAVLAVTDAAVIARYADAVVLVVRAGATHRDAALRARRQLEAVGARLAGFVLTDTPPDGQEYAYSYQAYTQVRRAGAAGAGKG